MDLNFLFPFFVNSLSLLRLSIFLLNIPIFSFASRMFMIASWSILWWLFKNSQHLCHPCWCLLVVFSHSNWGVPHSRYNVWFSAKYWIFVVVITLWDSRSYLNLIKTSILDDTTLTGKGVYHLLLGWNSRFLTQYCLTSKRERHSSLLLDGKGDFDSPWGLC